MKLIDKKYLSQKSSFGALVYTSWCYFVVQWNRNKDLRSSHCERIDLIMTPFPYPRAYIDWEIPLRQDGSRLECAESKEDYEFYVNWLADYLFYKDITIPESQRQICQKGVLDIAEEYSITTILDDIELAVLNGDGFEGFHKQELERWEEEDADIKEEYIDEDGINTYFTTEEQFARVAEEFNERREKVPASIKHADIPYRPILARHLKRFPKHKDRVKVLDGYFARIAENFQK